MVKLLNCTSTILCTVWGERGLQKVCALYACEIVDNFEQPLSRNTEVEVETEIERREAEDRRESADWWKITGKPHYVKMQSTL